MKLQLRENEYYDFVLKGEFYKGEIEGYGKMEYANGNVYIGYFKQGEREG